MFVTKRVTLINLNVTISVFCGYRRPASAVDASSHIVPALVAESSHKFIHALVTENNI